nr:acyl-CoA dehydratase activase [Candidatus Njordarchaeota archaeon]
MDIGSRNVKALLMVDNRTLSEGQTLCGFDQKAATEKLVEDLLRESNLSHSDIAHIVATGVGKNSSPYPASEITMVSADALGSNFLFPSARMVIDVGAENSLVVRCTEKGKVIDFAESDKCAAGSGTFIEAMARALEVKLEEIGPLSLKAKNSIVLNTQCTVFAESEVVSLIHQKVSKADIARAIHDSIANRIASLARRIRIQKDIVLVGGVALNVGFVNSLESTIGVELLVPKDPEFVGALGVALTYSKQKESGRR